MLALRPIGRCGVPDDGGLHSSRLKGGRQASSGSHFQFAETDTNGHVNYTMTWPSGGGAGQRLLQCSLSSTSWVTARGVVRFARPTVSSAWLFEPDTAPRCCLFVVVVLALQDCSRVTRKSARCNAYTYPPFGILKENGLSPFLFLVIGQAA